MEGNSPHIHTSTAIYCLYVCEEYREKGGAKLNTYEKKKNLPCGLYG